MNVDGYGLAAVGPAGWTVQLRSGTTGGPRAAVATPAISGSVPEVTRPVLQGCTRPIPAGVGDFGGGLVDTFGPDDVFVGLLDYGPEVAGFGLFDAVGIPRLVPSGFAGNRMPRYLPGMSASQQFFTVAGRGFCLYAVIGSHARRMVTVPRADTFVGSFRVQDGHGMFHRRAS